MAGWPAAMAGWPAAMAGRAATSMALESALGAMALLHKLQPLGLCMSFASRRREARVEMSEDGKIVGRPRTRAANLQAMLRLAVESGSLAHSLADRDRLCRSSWRRQARRSWQAWSRPLGWLLLLILLLLLLLQALGARCFASLLVISAHNRTAEDAGRTRTARCAASFS